jgi:hypothetical protein
MNLSTDPWIWVSAILTLAIFSFLYRDNPFYKFGEHLFVGVANGYSIAFIWHRVLVPVLFEPMIKGGQYWLSIPFIIGALYLTRFIPKVSWLVRIPIAISMGYSAGAAIPATIQADILKQIQGTILTQASFVTWQTGLWSVVMLLGVVATVSYFFFSREQRGLMRPVSRTGIVFIMIGFGASFGYTVMARISLLIGRLQFLLRDWLGVIE